jgi:hypothetical protein
MSEPLAQLSSEQITAELARIEALGGVEQLSALRELVMAIEAQASGVVGGSSGVVGSSSGAPA